MKALLALLASSVVCNALLAFFLHTSHLEQDKLLAELDLCKGKVEQMVSESEARQALIEQAQKEAKSWRRKYESKAHTLSVLPLPQGECDAMRTLVDAARAGSVQP